MGDAKKEFKAVIFNPVPGPPMGENTRLSLRHWLRGTGKLRVQIYSLSKGYHRFLTLTNLPPEYDATLPLTPSRDLRAAAGTRPLAMMSSPLSRMMSWSTRWQRDENHSAVRPSRSEISRARR
jgi:hypothetical protein